MNLILHDGYIMFFFSFKAELKSLQEMSSPSFVFARDLIKHNLVKTFSTLKFKPSYGIWIHGCHSIAYVFLLIYHYSWRLCSEGVRELCKFYLPWLMYYLRLDLTSSSTISNKVSICADYKMPGTYKYMYGIYTYYPFFLT